MNKTTQYCCVTLVLSSFGCSAEYDDDPGSTFEAAKNTARRTAELFYERVECDMGKAAVYEPGLAKSMTNHYPFYAGSADALNAYYSGLLHGLGDGTVAAYRQCAEAGVQEFSCVPPALVGMLAKGVIVAVACNPSPWEASVDAIVVGPSDIEIGAEPFSDRCIPWEPTACEAKLARPENPDEDFFSDYGRRLFKEASATICAAQALPPAQ